MERIGSPGFGKHLRSKWALPTGNQFRSVTVGLGCSCGSGKSHDGLCIAAHSKSHTFSPEKPFHHLQSQVFFYNCAYLELTVKNGCLFSFRLLLPK